MRSRPVLHVGTTSYGIYLIHLFVMPTVTAIQQRFGIATMVPEQPGLAQFVIVSGITLAVAAASWTFFEHPLNRLKNRFPYVSQPRPVTRAAAASVS
jgi:peptidoglycan/LPS O-acetylase OafA/YrhL